MAPSNHPLQYTKRAMKAMNGGLVLVEVNENRYLVIRLMTAVSHPDLEEATKRFGYFYGHEVFGPAKYVDCVEYLSLNAPLYDAAEVEDTQPDGETPKKRPKPLTKSA